MDSKLITGLSPLTDDKSAFRQWDLQLTNALNCVKRGYGDALKWLKEAIDRGEDPEDARPGASSEVGSARFGTILIEHLREVKVSEGSNTLDVDQLDRDPEFILIDKANIGSSILQRITNLKVHGGIRMYAEVYKWFTETSGLGLAEQMGLLMNPKAASKEEGIAEVIEPWEESVNRLARHGVAYRPPE